MREILTINSLTKEYSRITAVKDLSITVNEGDVFGLLGPNGSGKTTTLGVILGVIMPSQGSYQWFGGMDEVVARKQIGAILETPCFYSYLNAVQNLRIVAHIKECDPSRIDTVLKEVGLFERRNDLFKHYSLGMKQRLSIAAALLNDPPLLILDEPTNGLDPQGIADVRLLIQNLAQQGKTIIIASHLLDEIQKVCTRYCILSKGKKMQEGNISDILKKTNVVEIAADDLKNLLAILPRFDGAAAFELKDAAVEVTLQEGATPSQLSQFCTKENVVLTLIKQHTRSLEQTFLNIFKNDN